MNFFEQCKQCSVRIDCGSGVLFQPMNECYTYILTAKHNLYNKSEAKSINDMKYIRYGEVESKSILEKYEHSTLDIAILKIEKIDFESPYKEFEQPNNRDIFKFYGYPKNRRGETEKIKYFDLKVGDIEGFKITASNQEYFPQKDIDGCSGGGVFKQDGNNFYLVGIEHRMDAKSKEEVENNIRLKYININAFDEIVAQYEDKLAPLYPPYMSNFNLLIDNIFLLTGLMVEKEKVTNILKSIVDTHVKDKITPKQIFDKYNIGLLTKDEYKNELTNKELWTRYLEFLVISYLIDAKSITLNEIDVIYKRRKFLFAKTDDWTELIKELLSYDIKSLEKDGTVCIACDKDITPDMCEIPSGLLEKINHIPLKKMQINDGLSNPTEEIKIQHIHNFQREFIKKQTLLIGLNIQKIEERITDEAKNIFKKN